MRKFVVDTRKVPGKDSSLTLIVSTPTRIPRKAKKKMKSMVKRVTTSDILKYIPENGN